MVMEESVMHHHGAHSPSGGDTANAAGSTNVYLVGLEFVRQYYTVLNQGPLYLHRFYSDDSSFIHGVSGRDSKTAFGQQEIHKRIQSLNFHNCHAKIRQVKGRVVDWYLRSCSWRDLTTRVRFINISFRWTPTKLSATELLFK
jgi:hypothetical protein